MWSIAATARPAATAGASLAGQFLALQLAVLLLALLVTSVVSVRQSDAEFSETRGARLRAGAENLAGTRDRAPHPGRGRRASTRSRSTPSRPSGPSLASSVYIARPDGTIVAGTGHDEASASGSTSRPATCRTAGPGPATSTTAGTARSPLRSPSSPTTGRWSASPWSPRPTPRWASGWSRRHPTCCPSSPSAWRWAWPARGCWPRLIKRRTRGLEPAEISALADQREALLHSIREGVVAVGTDGRVTVLSDSARELLDLPPDVEGRQLADLPLAPSVRDVLLDDSDVRDAVLMVGGRVVVLNRNRVFHDGRQVGTVATLRDRTELLAMQSELNARESVTRTLRAQTHEFSNQLHTISGLLQLEEYDEAGARDRCAHPPPGRDQRRRDRPGRRPVRRRTAHRQGEPGGRTRHRPAARRRQRAPPARPRAVRRCRHGAGQPGRQRRRRRGRRGRHAGRRPPRAGR